MFKRTKGYWLLTLLVLTGLAGKIHNNTLSGKERRSLVKELKVTQSAFLDNIENLSDMQLNFREKNGLSIKQCVYKLASIENNLWRTAKNGLRKEPSKTARSFTDEELISCIFNQQFLTPTPEIKFKNFKEALKFYKNQNNQIVKYVNTSTENIRAYIIHTSIGNLDAYQLLMLNTAYTKKFMEQIAAIKLLPNFPK